MAARPVSSTACRVAARRRLPVRKSVVLPARARFASCAMAASGLRAKRVARHSPSPTRHAAIAASPCRSAKRCAVRTWDSLTVVAPGTCASTQLRRRRETVSESSSNSGMVTCAAASSRPSWKCCAANPTVSRSTASACARPPRSKGSVASASATTLSQAALSSAFQPASGNASAPSRAAARAAARRRTRRRSGRPASASSAAASAHHRTAAFCHSQTNPRARSAIHGSARIAASSASGQKRRARDQAARRCGLIRAAPRGCATHGTRRRRHAAPPRAGHSGRAAPRAGTRARPLPCRR